MTFLTTIFPPHRSHGPRNGQAGAAEGLLTGLREGKCGRILSGCRRHIEGKVVHHRL